MTDILEMIEDLEMLDALDTVSREAHLEFLINKYKTRHRSREVVVLGGPASAPAPALARKPRRTRRQAANGFVRGCPALRRARR